MSIFKFRFGALTPCDFVLRIKPQIRSRAKEKKLIQNHHRIFRKAKQQSLIVKPILTTLKLAMPFGTLFWQGNAPDNYKYWSTRSQAETMMKADELYTQQKYVEVYELLNRLKYMNQPDILWRIARALFKMAISQPDIPYETKRSMIYEARDILEHALVLSESNSNVHKWYAVIYDYYCSFDGLKAKVEALGKVRFHLKRAIEIDNSQTAIYFILGKISYDLASMTWFQRLIAQIFYVEPPEDSYEAAYEYFLKAEHLSPGFYIGNLLLLGKASVKLGKLHQARYYFNLATHCSISTEDEKRMQAKANYYAKELAEYDEISKNTLMNQS